MVERLDAGGFEVIDNAGDKGHFRANDNEIDGLGLQNATTAAWSP